ncbi:MAG: ASKHA domain-containing protein [Spirochaetes bacterium]|nr:ASKHA domain-containing protein [Spirochaetota bacterium]
MPRVEFFPAGKFTIVDESTLIFEAAQKAGVHLALPCGGKGTCKRCLVSVLSGDVVRFEHPPEDSPPSVVLACKTAIGQKDCRIQVQEWDFTNYDVDESYDFCDKKFFHNELLKPLVLPCILKVPAPQLDDGKSDVDRVNGELAKIVQVSSIHWPIAVLRMLPETLRTEQGRMLTLVYRSGDHAHLCAIEDKLDKPIYGIAVDLGTTTVSVALADLLSGDVVGIASGYNEQIICGEDIISRIHYARTQKYLLEVNSKAISTINRLISRLIEKNNISPNNIYAAVISGNTTMMHFLLGVTPEYLRLEPYTPAFYTLDYVFAEEIGLSINPHAIAYVSPAVGSYVGGDITAGILCTDMYNESGLSLFVDIGTNGEIVLGNRDFLFACACSAGPAFEGGGISCGMRAIDGAIYDIEFNEEGEMVKLDVIGDAIPKGICGSGIINILSKFLQRGIIDRSGKFVENAQNPNIKREGRKARFIFNTGYEGLPDAALFVNEQDIENVLRAKAAVFSAITTLLEFAGLTFADITKVYIAGGFGKFLNIDNAITIGLLPELSYEKFTYIGNASLMGSLNLLLSEKARTLQAELASKITYINLSALSNYHSQYTAALFFPHTNENLFPSSIKKITAYRKMHI